VDVIVERAGRGDLGLPVAVWRFGAGVRAIASGPLGGGLGARRWAINAQVPSDYAGREPARHLAALAAGLGLRGPGVGMMTAVTLDATVRAADGGVIVWATVGLGHPVLAAAPPSPDDAAQLAGTVNIVALVPAALSDAALVNAVATVTEAKSQAIAELGHHATGTATDAVMLACPATGPSEPFGGPRSTWGARLARAVHGAVLSGAVA